MGTHGHVVDSWLHDKNILGQVGLARKVGATLGPGGAS